MQVEEEIEKLKVQFAESLAQRQQVAANQAVQKVHLHRELFRTAGRLPRPKPQAIVGSQRLLDTEVSHCRDDVEQNATATATEKEGKHKQTERL